MFESVMSSEITVGGFLLCLAIALVAGLGLAFSYSYKNTYTKSFVITLATLPAIVCVIIIMVNGNIGTGVAVAGVFSLVRFRSIPGTAKEIGAIFIAMGAGLVFGMGYVAYGLIFVVVLSGCTMIYNFSRFGENSDNTQRTIKITVPEDLNYTNAFDDIFKKYTKKYKLMVVKTTNMGSLFKITYDIDLKEKAKEKQLIDALRTRNGNLEIVLSPLKNNVNEL
ncbi:MAG: DUF4956 domain-containing protein [Bacillota bacterium]